jgi:hypothetical protein
MSAKPTPGQWQFYRETTVDRGDGYGIKAPAPHHWVIPPLNLNPADVKLMAAAPDLFEACNRLVNCMRLVGWEGDDSTQFALWAISKAKTGVTR